MQNAPGSCAHPLTGPGPVNGRTADPRPTRGQYRHPCGDNVRLEDKPVPATEREAPSGEQRACEASMGEREEERQGIKDVKIPWK